ncbi:guanine deaminase [Velocimicrobium porci]|uniref:Guanine deaminase n=1 Tax=Velocimicrobium porci TaxID=2606634 RepID=A0A6L5XUH4_9FIRM|nr:guanine deaminase [Velocimicrobium porci]MSS62332.1 guanine deaminase [Velocimicrobium porci]
MFALHGHIIYSESKDKLCIKENGYVICEDGISQGVYDTLPEQYKNITVKDYGDRLIIPGLVDLHVHAPQYSFRGLGMDMELLDWLNQYTFPEEAKYKELTYAEKAYKQFVEELRHSPTTRACIFATLHTEATYLLMDLLEEMGMKAYVGKVNMDRNCPDYLREDDVSEAIRETKEWVGNSIKKYKNVLPIITPRFIPSCSDLLMKGLSQLQKETGLPAQSHLSENPSEIKWVQELCPDSTCYGDAYDRRGLFGLYGKTVMAHCVYSTEEEIEKMKENGVYVAHCPQSNTNLSSGIAPAKKYLERDLKIGLGTDLAGGHSISMFRAMADAIQVSKLRWRLLNTKETPLTIEEAFFMGTKGGGEFFGKVGSFEKGYEFDAVVLDDTSLLHPQELTVRSRLERMIYLSDDRNIYAKYIAGCCIV